MDKYGGAGVVKTQIAVNLWRQYLGNEGSYQKTVKGGPPLIYHAVSNYALEKWKGRLPSYLSNEGSYRKTVKGEPPQIYHAESNYALKKWKVVFHHISATKACIEKP